MPLLALLPLLTVGPVPSLALVAYGMRRSIAAVAGEERAPSLTWRAGGVFVAIVLLCAAAVVAYGVRALVRAGKAPWVYVAGIAAVVAGLVLLLFPEPITSVAGVGLIVAGFAAMGVKSADL